MLDLWFKNAVIYCLDVERFADSDGDGIGDFAGLTRRLDYLAGIGVTCLWLLPFFPSPNRDNGYDVADYYSVDSRHGTLGDFVEFTHQARMRGLRVMVDLVLNHTSDQHPWFQMARRDRSSKYRDYYVWSDELPEDADQGMVFPGPQESTWTYDDVAEAYYFHRFYHFQPDLNIGNPAVREEILKVIGFWLELGVSGFRLDAAPFLIELKHTGKPQVQYSFEFLKEMREFVAWRGRDTILLAEANVTMDEVGQYFGDADRLHMLFNFYLNQHLFLGLARREARPIIEALDHLPEIPTMAQWANFLRNHDELDLGRLSQQERQQVFEQFGPRPEMQLYGRGIRRRLAPMLGGDLGRLEMAFSLSFTLPGTPVLWYGEEIGMGEDLSLPERESVRTPMQWSNEPNGGFSTAPREKLVVPVVSGGQFGYEQVNVATQRRDPDSLLSRVERLIRTRKECPEFGWGRTRVLPVEDPAVLALLAEWEDGVVLALHNLAERPARVRLDLSACEAEALVDLLGGRQVRDLENSYLELEMEGYGYHWFRLQSGRYSS